MNCDAVSNVIMRLAAVKPTFRFSSSIFRKQLESFFLEHLYCLVFNVWIPICSRPHPSHSYFWACFGNFKTYCYRKSLDLWRRTFELQYSRDFFIYQFCIPHSKVKKQKFTHQVNYSKWSFLFFNFELVTRKRKK